MDRSIGWAAAYRVKLQAADDWALSRCGPDAAAAAAAIDCRMTRRLEAEIGLGEFTVEG